MTLFPRHTADQKAMAHRILDRAKAGQRIPDSLLRWALLVTGDFVGGGSLDDV